MVCDPYKERELPDLYVVVVGLESLASLVRTCLLYIQTCVFKRVYNSTSALTVVFSYSGFNVKLQVQPTDKTFFE